LNHHDSNGARRPPVALSPRSDRGANDGSVRRVRDASPKEIASVLSRYRRVQSRPAPLIALGPRVAIAATTANWRSTARAITDGRLEHGSEGQYTTGDSEEQDLLASGRVQIHQAKCELDDGEHRGGCDPGNGDDGPSRLLAMPARPAVIPPRTSSERPAPTASPPCSEVTPSRPDDRAGDRWAACVVSGSPAPHHPQWAVS